ncbi:DUF3055 domain-containing protein [Paenibacillus darwinianus]|uniref:DUF3055 domain-containing protein n=1 Tax=Paenibacillus darwinianus TaxID=1380763 RepID=UPI000A540197|nr:DUF3055 domain-containing protein [Paenibacillus darwinianus]
MLESLYDVTERAEVHFVGCVTEQARFDFSIVYTSQFFGKPMVICMQSGKSTLLSAEDLYDTDYVQRLFQIGESEVAEDLGRMLLSRLPLMEVRDQY